MARLEFFSTIMNVCPGQGTAWCQPSQTVAAMVVGGVRAVKPQIVESSPSTVSSIVYSRGCAQVVCGGCEQNSRTAMHSWWRDKRRKRGTGASRVDESLLDAMNFGDASPCSPFISHHFTVARVKVESTGTNVWQQTTLPGDPGSLVSLVCTSPALHERPLMALTTWLDGPGGWTDATL